MWSRTKINPSRSLRLLWIVLVGLLVLTPAHSDSDSPPGGAYRQNLDARAADLFSRVRRNPIAIDEREELAKRYRQLGYARLAEVYEASARFLKTGRSGSILAAEAYGWLCPVTARDVRALQAAIAGKLTPENRSAVAAAEQALKERGFSCELLVEWSRAYLFSQSADMATKSSELEEVAVRNLVTLGDDGNVHPSGLEGAATVYGFLAGYYSLRGDYVTAFIMAEAAKVRLREGSITGSQDRESFAKGLDDEIRSLKKLADNARRR